MCHAAVEPKERIERQLQEAVERLQADLVRVEIWAGALGGFSRPIPDYQPGDEMSRHLLPRCSDEGNSAPSRTRKRAAARQPTQRALTAPFRTAAPRRLATKSSKNERYFVRFSASEISRVL